MRGHPPRGRDDRLDDDAPVKDLAGQGPGSVVDETLVSFAQFTVEVVTDFRAGGDAFGGYDRKNHTYRPEYIAPRRWEIRLDARLGLELNRSPRPSARLALDAQRPPATVDELDRLLSVRSLRRQHGPGGHDIDLEPGSGRLDPGPTTPASPLVPKNLVGYQWVIEDDRGDWVDSTLVRPPVDPVYIAVFAVPRPSTYSVRLRVLFAEGRHAENHVKVRFDESLFVCLGDSMAAGEGSPDQQGDVDVNLGGGAMCDWATTGGLALDRHPPMSDEPVWTEERAHRSLRSGPALAALSVQHDFDQTWLTEPRDSLSFHRVVFASFARSGAGIFDGMIGRQEAENDFIGVGQVEECRRAVGSRRIDVLPISIGGNDAGFSGVLTDLVRQDVGVFGVTLSKDNPQARRELEQELDSLLGVGLDAGDQGELAIRFDTLRDRIDTLRRSPGVGHVIITGYPTGLFDTSRDTGQGYGFKACEVFSNRGFGISADDGAFIRTRGEQLNRLIRSKAEEYGWHYVDVAADFAGHGYCSSDSYWVKAEESCHRQGDFDGTMHPNRRGQQTYALRISEAIRSALHLPEAAG